MQLSILVTSKRFNKTAKKTHLFLPFLCELSPPLPPFSLQPLGINQAENTQMGQPSSAAQVPHEAPLMGKDLMVTYGRSNRILRTRGREMGRVWFPLKHK